jgi:hypothetical protein
MNTRRVFIGRIYGGDWITPNNVNLRNEHGETALQAYSKYNYEEEYPQKILQIYSYGYITQDDDYKALESCYRTRKIKSARLLLEMHPHWFSRNMFEYMHKRCLNDGMIQFVDMGFSLVWFTPQGPPHIRPEVAKFDYSRKRARERALIVLGVPRLRRGTGITKDVAQIIARVIWALRKFN